MGHLAPLLLMHTLVYECVNVSLKEAGYTIYHRANRKRLTTIYTHT